MERDLGELAGETFDVLVVGGGVIGAAVARESARWGLRTALLESEDFGAATSWNSLKTIHGGFRHMQHLDLRRVVESIAERRDFLRLAPHLVRNLAFLLPTHGWGMRSRAALGAALGLYDLAGMARNRGLPEARSIEHGGLIDVEELKRVVPGFPVEGVSGAARWWDAQMYSSERVVLELVQAALQSGASAANHVTAMSWLRSGSRIQGVRARDELTGDELEVRARCTVNCTGASAWKLLERPGGAGCPPPTMSLAANLVLRRPLVHGAALGIVVSGVSGSFSQAIFLAPWRERTLLGTIHLPVEPSGRGDALGEEQQQRLLDAVNRVHPAAELDLDDVLLVHTGILPVARLDPRTGEVQHTPKAVVVDHRRADGTEGLFSMVGVKFTEAIRAAGELLPRVASSLGRPEPGPLADAPLPGGRPGFDAVDSPGIEALPPGSSDHLLATFGTGASELLPLVRSEPPLAEPVTGGSPVIAAQVVHAARGEMACTLSDVVLRRTELGARGDADEKALGSCGDLMARELGWSADRLSRELDETRSACRALARGTSLTHPARGTV